MGYAFSPVAPMSSCTRFQVRPSQGRCNPGQGFYLTPPPPHCPEHGPKQNLGVEVGTKGVLSCSTHQLPPSVASEEIFKIASMAPGALLLEAQKEYEVNPWTSSQAPRCFPLSPSPNWPSPLSLPGHVWVQPGATCQERSSCKILAWAGEG